MRRAFLLTYHLGILCALLVGVANAQDRAAGISVIGECLKKVVRDRGAVTIASSLVAPTARESSRKTTDAHQKIKEAISALKVQELSIATVGYSVNRECTYDGRSSKPSCTGYRTTISTKFETPTISNLEDIVGAASQMGAEDISQLEIFVSPTLMQRERESCLAEATRNAHLKAEKIAQGGGVTLGKLLSVSELQDERGIHPTFARSAYAVEALADGAAAKGPSIDAQPLDLKVSVTVVYGIQ